MDLVTMVVVGALLLVGICYLPCIFGNTGRHGSQLAAINNQLFARDTRGRRILRNQVDMDRVVEIVQASVTCNGQQLEDIFRCLEAINSAIPVAGGRRATLPYPHRRRAVAADMASSSTSDDPPPPYAALRGAAAVPGQDRRGRDQVAFFYSSDENSAFNTAEEGATGTSETPISSDPEVICLCPPDIDEEQEAGLKGEPEKPASACNGGYNSDTSSLTEE